AGNDGGTRSVYRDGGGGISPTASKIAEPGQCVGGRVLTRERVDPTPKLRLKDAGGHRQIGGTGLAREVEVAARVHGKTKNIIIARRAEIAAVNEISAAVKFGDEAIDPSRGTSLNGAAAYRKLR